MISVRRGGETDVVSPAVDDEERKKVLVGC